MECDQRDPRGDPARCQRAGVRVFPTWMIGGNRYEGVLTLDELARYSGWTPPAAAK